MLDEILTYFFTKFWSLYINIMLRRKGRKESIKNERGIWDNQKAGNHFEI